MTEIFVNGGAPNYAGELFTTSADLINILDINFQAAGWTILNKVADTSLFVRGVTANGHNCWYEFVVSVDTSKTNGRLLTLRGYQNDLKTIPSPDATHVQTFIEGSVNRLWFTLDSDAGCISIYSADGIMRGHHFGFLDRIDLEDPWAFMIGHIHVRGYEFAYTAKAKHNNVDWRLLSNDFYASTSASYGDNGQCLPVSTFDLVRRGKPANTYNETQYWPIYGNRGAFYLAYNGYRNYTNRAVLDEYSYIEGRGANNDYGSTSKRLYHRGSVKYAYCGVASEAAGSQCRDVTSGFIIMSVGASQWQGMRIA